MYDPIDIFGMVDTDSLSRCRRVTMLMYIIYMSVGYRELRAPHRSLYKKKMNVYLCVIIV